MEKESVIPFCPLSCAVGVVASIILVLYMAVISRACGGWFRLPAENFLYALPYFLPIWAITHNPYLCAISVIFAGILKGQANREYMDLGSWTSPIRKPHNYSFLFNWLHLPPYWHDFLGLTLVGLAPALIPSIMAGYFDPTSGLILAIGGASKSMAYAFAKKAGWGTEGGESLTGAFAGLSIILASGIFV